LQSETCSFAKQMRRGVRRAGSGRPWKVPFHAVNAKTLLLFQIKKQTGGDRAQETNYAGVCRGIAAGACLRNALYPGFARCDPGRGEVPDYLAWIRALGCLWGFGPEGIGPLDHRLGEGTFSYTCRQVGLNDI